MKRTYLLLSALGCIVVVLSLVQITVSNMLSTGGIELAQVESQIDAYQKNNAILKEQIYSISSLTYVAGEAAKMGYVPEATTSTLVIANPAPLAIKP